MSNFLEFFNRLFSDMGSKVPKGKPVGDVKEFLNSIIEELNIHARNEYEEANRHQQAMYNLVQGASPEMVKQLITRQQEKYKDNEWNR